MIKRYLLSLILCLFSINMLAYDSYEHIATGTNGVKLKFPKDSQVYEDFPYKTYYDLLLDPKNEAKVGKIEYYPQYILLRKDKETLKLSYGEYIAIAGDFAGRLDGTISSGIELKDFEKMRPELEASFLKAFEAILPYRDNPLYQKSNLDYLRGLFKHEYQSLILKLGNKGGIHFNNASSHSITSTVKDQWAYAKSPGYVELLSNNVDHFENDAKISYAIGHTLALEKAKKAFELREKGGTLDEAVDMLNLAYAMDAFASHFLTDLFSSGHLRTPRGPLLAITKSAKNRAQGYTSSNVGLMANAMHDEDNYAGLWLKNKYGQVWNAFGDGSFFDIKSADNRQAIREALQASVDEVFDAYDKGTIVKYKDFKAMKLIGVPLESSSDFVSQLANPFPLFRLGKNWPEVRKNYYDNGTGDYQAITQATGGTSFYKSDLGIFNHGNFNSFLLEAHLVEPLKQDVLVECYNTFNRDSILPVRTEEYTVLNEAINMIYIDNSNLQFYKTILLGDLRPDGIYYVVNEETGAKIIEQCKHSMETMYKLGQRPRSEVVEIRGRIGNYSFSHPVVYYNGLGQLLRLLGYKANR